MPGPLSLQPVAADTASIPRQRPIQRDHLIRRITGSAADVIAVVAGAGYGKTTLLQTWAERDGRPLLWLALDPSDDDAAVLLADLAEALHRAAPLDDALLRRLTSGGARVPATRTRELTRHMARVGQPALVVLDDLQSLSSHGALDTVSSLIDHLPTGWTLALASRVAPDLHLARLRTEGRLLELDERDLAMDLAETGRIMRAAKLDLPDGSIQVIVNRTEGWAAAIQLAALSLRDQGDPVEAAARFGGDDRLIRDYVREELLQELPRNHRRFMIRTSILDELTPDLCDAVLGCTGSGVVLDHLERTNAFVVPVAGQAGTYRYHHLLRGVLREELHRRAPRLEPELYRRAMAWCEGNGHPAHAVGYAHEGGHDLDAARLVCTHLRRFGTIGRFETLRRWLAWFDDDAMRAYPPLAVAAGWYHAFAGDEEPIRWLRLAEASTFARPMPDGTSFAASASLLRAAMCLDGPERMDEDIRASAELGSPTSGWQALHHLLAGEAAMMLGQTERARGLFEEGVDVSGPAQAAGQVMLLSELAALAQDEGAWDEAGRHAARALALSTEYGLGDAIRQPMTHAVAALVSIHRGQHEEARAALVEAQKLRASSSFTIPSFSIRGRIWMARAYLGLADVDGARTVVREARDFQARRPKIGTLRDMLDAVEAAVRGVKDAGRSGPGSLSVAELRVLALLPTHRTFREIGERLFVSANTVKSHAVSIYRKLGVSSRSEAVERATELGLLDP